MKKIKDFHTFFVDYLVDHNISIVWHLGDFWENRRYLNIFTIHEAKKFLDSLEENNIRMFIIYGNHDTYFKNISSINSIDPIFKSYSNITIIPDYTVYNFDGLDVGFLSWMATEEKEKGLQFINSISCPILCGHLEINNFEVIRGVVCRTGLNLEIFDRFDLVMTGHFHIKATNGRVHYLGNPYETNWGEYGYKKGFHVFDTQSLELSFIENPTGNYHLETYNNDTNLSKLDDKIYRDKIVRILLEDNTYDKNKFNIFHERISDIAYSVEVIESREEIKLPEIEEVDVFSISTLELIRQYIDHQPYSGLDKDRLQQYVLDIYREALERPNIMAFAQ